ncbi:MAG: MarR family transcriptional regulator [Burkholderiaceae bacterium]|nr:MarR family transcriptional regulator [Burkholderiaceae bacterium]
MKTSGETTSEPFPLSDLLCFAVYSTNLAFGKAYKEVLDDLGLTYTQYITVIALQMERDPTVGSLGEKLFLESNTLTPILKKLEVMGYVERQRDIADERLVRVRLTEGGRQVHAKAMGQISKVVEATGLLPDEYAMLQRGIVALRDSLVKTTRSGKRPRPALVN